MDLDRKNRTCGHGWEEVAQFPGQTADLGGGGGGGVRLGKEVGGVFLRRVDTTMHSMKWSWSEVMKQMYNNAPECISS